MITTLTEIIINVLLPEQGSSSLPLSNLAAFIDEKFAWIVESPFEVAIILILLSLLTFIIRKIDAAETFFWLSIVFIVCGLIFDQRSIDLVFPEVLGGVKTQMAYVKLMLIGLVIMLSLKYNPKGLLPEIPYRPERPKEADSE